MSVKRLSVNQELLYNPYWLSNKIIFVNSYNTLLLSKCWRRRFEKQPVKKSTIEAIKLSYNCIIKQQKTLIDMLCHNSLMDWHLGASKAISQIECRRTDDEILKPYRPSNSSFNGISSLTELIVEVKKNIYIYIY